MKTLKKILISFSAIIICLTLGGNADVQAQKKLQNSLGGYHGELDFPISWKQYYGYEEWTQIMKDIAKKYPHLASVESIGKSRMGRDQYLITITNRKTGAPEDKTAMWVDGAVHGNEVNGITCSLYLMWYLLTRYDYDAYVYDLVNNSTFYILPGLNVDGNESFVNYPNTPNNPREPYRPEDNDGDGLYDEDQTEDIDGDGELSTMYIEDPKGRLKLSEDKRRFVTVEDDTYPGLRFKRIGSEGYDNDGDGRINEDDIGGPDPNRNYPYGWNMASGNPYPMSEPCTRNAYEFHLAHPNIFATFHYHNTGRLIMFQVPQPVKSSTAQQSQTAGPYSMTGRRGMTAAQRLEQMRKENKYAQYFDRRVPREFQHDLDVQTNIVTVGARILKNYRPTMGGLSGQTAASTYNMLGTYSYLIELWGTPTFDIDINNDGRASEEEYMQWIDIEMTGEGWITPHKFDHPDLGEIWIGGSAKKHIRRTPPGRYIESEADRNAKFVMYCASQFPKVEIADITTTDLGDGLFWVDVTVENERTYPTASDRAKKLKLYDQDVLNFSSSKGISLIKLDAKLPIQDPYQSSGRFFGFRGGGNRSSLNPGTGEETKLWVNGKDKKVYRYLISKSGGNNWVEVAISSVRGGMDKMRIEL